MVKEKFVALDSCFDSNFWTLMTILSCKFEKWQKIKKTNNTFLGDIFRTNLFDNSAQVNYSGVIFNQMNN